VLHERNIRLPRQKMRSGEDIKRYVEDELKWDPNVDSTDIGVGVNKGVVTLAGFVRSFAHKLGAESAAKRVAGVAGLANDLEVRLPGADERPDPEIARDAVTELKAWLPDAWRHVRPVVRDGWVTLEGEVEWNFQRDYAERALHWIAGIKGSAI
jgi:osmotically-inducible protein OsmY